MDKLNKIAKKINENVELSDRDLIIDSLDSITKAYGGTPNDSTLIVDKLDDIYNNIGSAPSGNIEITENTAEGEPLDIAQYATATVNVAGGGGVDLLHTTISFVNERDIAYEPSIVALLGYAVNLHDFNANADNTLYSSVNDSPNKVDLNDLSVSVPRNSTLTFNAYYHPDMLSGDFYPNIFGISDNATATNMEYEEGNWYVIDSSENSTISYVIAK